MKTIVLCTHEDLIAEPMAFASIDEAFDAMHEAYPGEFDEDTYTPSGNRWIDRYGRIAFEEVEVPNRTPRCRWVEAAGKAKK